MSEDKFAEALEREGISTEALERATSTHAEQDRADTAASLDEAYTRVQQIKAEAAADPSHAYHNALPEFWMNLEAPVTIARIKAGLPPTPQPKTLDQRRAEHHARSFPMGDVVNENLADLITAGLQAFHGQGTDHVKAETAKLREELGSQTHDKMIADAKSYLGTKYNDSVAGYLPALRVATSQVQRNRAKAGKF